MSMIPGCKAEIAHESKRGSNDESPQSSLYIVGP